ncbi:hypothetical protein KJ991_01105 [Patescibacteria group bacterium]|nr:hypothetical protein [Patescibacteria group bacterium]MBU4057646.1 hypothetical protein [Patescibacteria group bacterium]MBU4115902.1 hypothetical protein [Patescibacteria group bacterium]
MNTKIDKHNMGNNFSVDEANKEYIQNGGIEGLNKNKNNEMKKIIIVGVIFFITGFIVSYVFGGGIKNFILKNKIGEIENVKDNGVLNNENIDLSTQAGEKTFLSRDTVAIESQPFGDSVIISGLDLEETVWVTIYESLENGELGNILGAGVFDKGSYKNANVELLRGTEGDSKYYVKLLKDDGDRTFDHVKDLPVKDFVTKKDIMVMFKTTSGMPR